MSADTSTAAVRPQYAVAASYEAGIWRSLYRWLARRPRTADSGAVLFSYAGQVTPILIVFIVLGALEIPIVSLLLPWPEVRYPLLVLGVWGLLWMLGLLASLRVNPHVVSDTGLQLRSSFQFDALIPWDQISDIRGRLYSSSGRKFQIEEGEDGASVAIQGTVNAEVTTREPVVVQFMDGRQAEVQTIRFYADSPTAFVATSRGHLRALVSA